MSNFRRVIELCSKEYPENNERILGSAHFSLGCLQLELGEREESKVNLQAALAISKKFLIQKLIEKGCDSFKVEEADAINVPKLCAPSIFDDQ